jgi:hypothetical protein
MCSAHWKKRALRASVHHAVDYVKLVEIELLYRYMVTFQGLAD